MSAVPRPMRVVFDRTARLPLESRLIRTVAEAPVTVVSTAPDPGRASALERAGAAVVVAPTGVEALRALRTRGVRSLLLEGGPRLVGAFLDACVVDRLVIFQAPVLLGSGAEPAFAFAPPATAAAAPRRPVLEHRSVGGDWMTVYALSTL